MNKFSLIIAIFVLSLMSCENNNYEELLTDLEIYNSKIDSSILIMEKYNAANFHEIYKEMSIDIENYNKTINDSLQLNVIIKDIGQYASLSKYFKKTGSKHKSLYDELVLTKNQFETLKLDIEDNELTPEKVELYYKKETQIANLLFAETVRMSDEAENNLLLFDSLKQVIINLQDSIK